MRKPTKREAKAEPLVGLDDGPPLDEDEPMPLKAPRGPIRGTEWWVFEAPPGERLTRFYVGISVDGGAGPLWWSQADRKWLSGPQEGKAVSNLAPCRTLRAFRSHLRRHRHDLRECSVRLHSRYQGHDVWAFLPPY